VLQIFNRLTHQVKVFVGHRLGRYLSKRYLRGRGPASRLISVFSEESKKSGVEENLLIAPTLLKKSAPVYFLNGKSETEYQSLLLSGEQFTTKAGIFSASNVDVTFPTSMHQVGEYILSEVMLVPYLLTNPKYYFGLESMRFTKKRPMEEGILLSMPFYHNFYHWLIEILPRLISYDRYPSLHHVPLIVPSSAPGFVAETLRLTGYLSKTVFLENGTYRFKKLHMLSKLSSIFEVSPDAIAWLNDKFKDVGARRVTPKKIYISRGDAKIRFVSNEPQLTEVLTDFGFETMAMSGLSIPDQINLFRNAQYVIGAHGAAFANLAFAKPGATFIEFFSKGHYAPCFNRISGSRGLKYGFLVGGPTRMGGFEINPDHLRTILVEAVRAP
jgi:hypothetical protein